jgi:hypothetical protein
VKVALEQATKAQRASREMAVIFLINLSARWRWTVNVTPRPLYPHERDQVPIVQEAGWAPGPVWTGAENIALTGIRSPDRPARSESLYRLGYPSVAKIMINLVVWLKNSLLS